MEKRNQEYCREEIQALDGARLETIAWKPEVVSPEPDPTDQPLDHDPAEVWHWFIARLRALGELEADQARLTALMNWRENTVAMALHAARLDISEKEHHQGARQVHIEFLAAEYMARQALDLEPIPHPEPRLA